VTSAVTALILSFLITTTVTPVVRRWATHLGAVDQPGGRRVHVHATPRLGGLAVILGFFLPLGLFALIHTDAMTGFLQQSRLVLGLVLGSAVVGIVGAVDDVRGLGPWVKLLAQAFAGSIAYAAGYCINAVNLPIVGDINMGVFALPVTVFWFLAITNAINLIDGLDGLAAGITLFATLTNLAIAHVNGYHTVVLLSAGLGGSLLGFLRYNFNPATIFLGDSGSMFLGFTLAATSLAGGMTKSSTAVALLAPIIALGVPILDTLLAMIRRTLARQSIFVADRGHIHHRLLDLGLTHRRVVLVLYLFSILLALSSVAIAFGRSWNIGLALVAIGAALFCLVRVGFRAPETGPAPPDDLELTGLRNEFACVIDAIHGSMDAGELSQAVQRLDTPASPVIQLSICNVALRSNAERDTGSIYEVDVGALKLFVRLRFCRELSRESHEEIAGCARALGRAYGEALTRLAPAAREAPSLAGKAVRIARSQG
jgi:UDP-GlcNAc:undecaprenyl-phosphate/decaprenyl-phosphate GlcNAc-1-phosphate transferase